jgi:multidrug resistance efflux pump
LQWLLGLTSETIARWHLHRSVKHKETLIRSLGDTIGLINSLDQTTSTLEASLVITNHLRRSCQAEQVAISFCDSRGKATLSAISDVEQIDLNCESNKLVSIANEQSLIAEQELCYPAVADAPSPHLLALEKYCKANGFESCINLPLITFDKRTIGAVLIACRAEKVNDPSYRQYVGQLINVAAGHIDVVLRANRRTRDVFRNSWKKIRSANLTKAILIALACMAALMLVPLPYRVSCECEIQPVLRRFVAAPYQGILEKTFVESGDVIETDHVVAHLDGRQLRMELSGLRAEFAGARKRRDSALAQGDVALSQIASSEMKRHNSKIEILEQNLTNLEVRSPIAGIVISGDLEKVEGAPVEMGQTLFEIAPLDQMLAEIGIPESEIQYVKAGMQVDIKLNAFPFKTWTGIVEQIHPRTEIINDESVFVAQVKLSNEENQLRPGMKGSAKIKTKSAPIGWNLFHQSWESVRYWMIW